MKAKGHDWSIAVLKDGKQIDALSAFNSVEVDFGLDVEVSNHVGERSPRVTGVNKEATLGCPFDVESPEYLKLINYQRLKNLPNAERQNIRIDIAVRVDFGPEGAGNYGFSDCTLSGAGLSISGRAEQNTTSSPTFTAPTWEYYS